ncbi:MAG TPA: CBS domain-containing protein [Mycobacteriales bacterium]|jgi:CBS domain-containing protein|nr:CBS domain-containing protein [Mycobacteriales bacterium]
MLVRDAMTGLVVTVGPTHTLREAAKAMSARRVGAAVLLDGDGHGPGILTERDILDALAEGADPDTETVEGHLTTDAVIADPDWSLRDAATAMVKGGFRHLVVVEAGEVVGVLSVRDVLRTGVSAAV